MANPNPSPSTRFLPGQSGNPKGGRRGALLTPLIREALLQTEIRGKDGKVVPLPDGKTVGHLLVELAIKHTMNGNPAFFKELISRTDGQVLQTHEISGLDRAPIQVVKVIQPPPRDDPSDDNGESLRN